ncbi:metalloproteinase inhibitor 3-like [Atheta coriaria]|uniref:metalloproteinase inhibitor 3-like n=1 Tax=Dalotia coriaria TaxID=877792 RepID=UPI0031F38118
MRRVGLFFVLGIIFFLQACVDRGEACSCQPRHPQQHLCSADFVILARVKRETLTNETREYKIKIRKEYKMSEKAYVALKFGRLVTARDDSMCGTRLEVNKVYAISGRVVTLQARIGLCDMAEKWDDLTRRQRKGLKLMYRQGCTCEIKFCPKSQSTQRGRCARTKDACNWDTWLPDKKKDCQRNEGICLRNSKKQCIWSRNLALTTCTRNSTVMHYEPKAVPTATAVEHPTALQAQQSQHQYVRKKWTWPKKAYSPFRDDPDRRSGQ